MLARHDTGMKHFIIEYSDDWEKLLIVTHIRNLIDEMKELNRGHEQDENRDRI